MKGIYLLFESGKVNLNCAACPVQVEAGMLVSQNISGCFPKSLRYRAASRSRLSNRRRLLHDM